MITTDADRGSRPYHPGDMANVEESSNARIKTAELVEVNHRCAHSISIALTPFIIDVENLTEIGI